jgi:acyl-CoA reductase-like NAD-dependent aldehyde dehydrogenase
MDDENAQIAAFVNPAVAIRTSELVERGLYEDGAEEVSARYREGGRLVEYDGYTYLLPTIVRCDKPGHPLANTELLFPFASVVESPQDKVLDQIGSTLVLSVITHDDEFIARALSASNVDRLNVGAVPTVKVSWDQPHEGNLFEHLYKQRALQLSRA